MKPLRDLVLIKKEKNIQEEKTSSGLYIINGETAEYNFKDDEDISMNVLHKKNNTTKDLNNKLIEHARKKSGNHIEFYPGGGNIKFSELEKNEKLKDLIYGRGTNKAKIISTGCDCSFVVDGDEIIYNKSAGLIPYEDNQYIVSESQILAVVRDGWTIIHPEFVLVKITAEARANVFKKKIVTQDGGESFLFLPTVNDPSDGRYSQFFVTCGEVIQVGGKVKNAIPGDIAILNYLCDTNDNIIVGYDGEDKLIAVRGLTTRYDSDEIVYQNRHTRRDQIVHLTGDYKDVTEIIAVIRNEELVPFEPYVFLDHQSTIVTKKTASGIEYTVDEKILERTIIASSKESDKRCGISKGKRVLVDDFDIFLIELEGRKISAVNDIDIIAGV